MSLKDFVVNIDEAVRWVQGSDGCMHEGVYVLLPSLPRRRLATLFVLDTD